MRIDPKRGAKIERAVRNVFQSALADHDLDETDLELLEMAVNQQVIILFLDSCSKNRVLLSEQCKLIYAQAAGVLDCCLAALELENPYRRGRLN